MKKLLYLFALLFTISTSFVSCRDTEQSAEDEVEEVGDDIEDGAEEVEEEF